VQVFAMRSMPSEAAFHRAYLHATQQAFLEVHEQVLSQIWPTEPPGAGWPATVSAANKL
jgi:hypothetical protein